MEGGNDPTPSISSIAVLHYQWELTVSKPLFYLSEPTSLPAPLSVPLAIRELCVEECLEGWD